MKRNSFFLLFLFLAIGCFAKSTKGSKGSKGAKGSKQLHEITLGTSFDKPLGVLSWSHKSAIGYGLNYNYAFSNPNESHMSVGVYIEYTNFQPLKDTLYFLYGNSYGTSVFSVFSSVSYGLNANWVWVIGKFRPYVGISSGYSQTQYTCSTVTPDATLGEEVGSARGKIAPTVGLSFMFTKNIGVFCNSKIAWMIPIAAQDPQGHQTSLGNDASTSLGDKITFFSVNTGLVIHF